jgi:hypothetical protein
VHFQNILAVHWKALLVGHHALNIQILFLFAPGKREGMAGPEPDRGHIEICMLARSESPRARHANGNAKRVARKDLDISFGAPVSDISHEQANHTE